MLPIFYTFRRCPFAIRARLSLAHSGVSVELREISLKSKPQALLSCSPKGTVPVLLLPSGQVVDESLNIMRWAYGTSLAHQTKMLNSSIIEINDTTFKYWLDRYKYADRHIAYTQAYSRSRCMEFIDFLEFRLSANTFLAGDEIGSLDCAILPFVRQFNGVDPNWLKKQGKVRLIQWLEDFCNSEQFKMVMAKQPKWLPESGMFVRSKW